MITRENVTETECHQFAAEASTLGLRPGEWPSRLDTELGNKMPFVLREVKVGDDGDLWYVRYSQSMGCVTLKIFND